MDIDIYTNGVAVFFRVWNEGYSMVFWADTLGM